MVTLCLLICGLIGSNASNIDSTEEDPSTVVKSALGKQGFPWYDAKTDTIRRIDPAGDPQQDSSTPVSSGPGQLVALLGFAIALVVLIGLLVWFWRIFEPVADAPQPPSHLKRTRQVGEPPDGLHREFALDDAWAEALRLKSQGDLAGAIVCLFAHQLLTMSKLGVVRLAPGRTGRQLVRAVTDSELRTLVQPTLRLFEVVYYGHREPTVAEFETTWSQAETFERRVAAGGVR